MLKYHSVGTCGRSSSHLPGQIILGLNSESGKLLLSISIISPSLSEKIAFFYIIYLSRPIEFI